MTAVTDPSLALPAVVQATPAISLSHVSKQFRLPHQRYSTLKERALHPFSKQTFDVLQAVDDVSIDIHQGEFFGIVGRNGSGKSTLLKCLAGIYRLDAGALTVRGRVAPFIELGVGFNPDLPARDNVMLNAIMLGLTQQEAQARFDDIVAFAELEEFVDLKLKNYSSGMYIRLAFSVAVQVDADIILIDEVLAVGDAAFQQKCFDEFDRLKRDGHTIVFVTHDMGAVEHFCDRAALLERGRVAALGDPNMVAREYNRLNFRRVREEAVEQGGPEVLRRPPVAELLSATFESEAGEPITTSHHGDPCVVRLEVQFHADAENPIFGIVLRDHRNNPVFATSTEVESMSTGRFRAGDTAHVRIKFPNWFSPGPYTLDASITPDGVGSNAYDLRAAMSTVIVLATRTGGAAVDLPHTIVIDRHAAATPL
jgi:ABC-type polysaccharide/polyol phosphate transport system ATPase subunit